VSSARGGEPSAFEPGLEHLIGSLTASGHPHELAGRDAVRAAFCAASHQPTPARSAPARSAPARSAWRRRPIRIALPARLAVAITAVVAVFGGFTAAAAGQVLPAPVQRIAYSVLAPLGVPVSQPTRSPSQTAPLRHPSPVSGPASSHGGCPCPTDSARSAGSGTPHHRIRKPTAKAKPKPKAKPKAKAKKSNAAPVLRLVSKRLKDDLLVAANSGQPGNIVTLTEWTGAGWTTIASAPLGPGLSAAFVLPVKTAAGHLFEAEVPEGAPRAAEASNRLWIPRAAATGAKAIQPDPTTSPAGMGIPTPTPTQDPSASATAPATSTPPQTPEPSTSKGAGYQ
jgi:hypothetical protein